MQLFGREQIFSDVEAVSASNVLETLNSAKVIHDRNRNAIDYLYKYYKGDQPVLQRTKTVRPEICNRIVENHANEIVSFKTGYLCGEPIQYISVSTEKDVGSAVAWLNDQMRAQSKASKDKALVEWQMIAGTSYRAVLVPQSDTPFEIITLDPRQAFVIRSTKIGNPVIAGVFCAEDTKNVKTYSVYTDKEFFEIKNGEIKKSETHLLGRVPIVEYPANSARIGAFETVITILDAINTLESNRVDGVEQFVQSLMKFVNCEIDKDSFAELQQLGAIMIKSSNGVAADVELMTSELNQDQTQTFIDHLHQTYLDICGMPNRNGNGSSTSDTGAASLLRDGWTLAESRAKDSETVFKESENELLKIVLPLCASLGGKELKLTDIDIRFTRRNYENIQTKAQVLCEMLNNPKIDPKLAFTHCGLFTDSEEAYRISMEWYEKNKLDGETREDKVGDDQKAQAGREAGVQTSQN